MILSIIKNNILGGLLLRFYRGIRFFSYARANWSRISAPILVKPALGDTDKKRILIATSTGSNWPCSSFESLLGIALFLRGADVSFLLCDGVLPACQECDRQWLTERDFVHGGPSFLCNSCYKPAQKMLEPLGLPIHKYSDFLRDEDTLTSDGKLYLEHARAGALRYFGRGNLQTNEVSRKILDRYLSASSITATVMRRLIAKHRPDVVVFHHGIYVPQGVIGDVLREEGIRIVNWGPAYRKSSVLFSHGNTYHHTMTKESPMDWSNMIWSEQREKQIMDYLHSRRKGNNDWISFQPNAQLDPKVVASRLDLDLTRPVVGLLTNVIWDAQLHFKQSAFPSMLEWLFASIEYFKQRSDVQWVIRVHPAEVRGTVPSQQKALDEIKMRFGKLPEHIKLVGPEDSISTYSLMALCNAALAYGTKMALELSCTGLPVVVAGEAWSRGKGFTIDVSSPEEYRKILESLPLNSRLSKAEITVARKYAYHFFFRRMIPVQALKPMDRFSPYKVEVEKIEELMPGYDPGLDLICEGIVRGTPFIYNPKHD
jgi:hypothetical protein